MRVSKIKFRKMLEDEKSKITDEEFFTSRIFRNYLADIAEATSGRYKKPVKIQLDWDESEDADIAYTDNKMIYINAANRLTAEMQTRAGKTKSLIGLLAHEIGHVLYSDFGELQRFVESLRNGKFYPAEPQANTEIEEAALYGFDKAFRDGNKIVLSIAAEIASSFLNIIEDVYIEARMCYRFPGSFKSGIHTIAGLLLEGMPTLQDQLEKKLKPVTIAHNLVLEYARRGDINNPDGLENEYTEMINRVLLYIDDAIYNDDVNERHGATNKILLNLWSFIEEASEKIEEKKDDSKSGEEKSSDELLKELLDQLSQSAGQRTVAPKGRNKPAKPPTGSNPNKEKPGKDELAKTAPKRKKLKAKQSKGTKARGKEKDGSSDSKASDDAVVINAPTGKDSTPADGESADAEVEGVPAPSAGEDDQVQDVADHETGRIPFHETEDFDDEGDGGLERNKEYEGSGYDKTASDIERLLERMAQERVEELCEAELASDLQTEANEIRYGDAHKGIRVRVNRMVQVSDEAVEYYNQVSAPLLKLSKRLQQKVAQILTDRRDGGKLTGLLFGKRYNVRDAVRNDGRQFYNTRLPQDPQEIAVAILNDESGSMSSNDRVTAARATSIVLHDFCQGLGFPIAIYGHSTGTKCVELYAHAEFDAADRKDKYRLMDISSRSGNRDGAALRFVAERLMKRPEPIKLLILISDGQPADLNYSGTAAEADLRGIKKEYQCKGINLFAAAIGSDKENLERIYGDGFLDITDLNKLPVNMCALLSRYIKAM